MATYTIRTLADHWSVSNNTLYNLIFSHRLDAFKVGHDWRILEAAVTRYEAENSAPWLPELVPVKRARPGGNKALGIKPYIYKPGDRVV